MRRTREEMDRLVEARIDAPLSMEEMLDLDDMHRAIGIYSYEELAHLVTVLLRGEEVRP